MLLDSIQRVVTDITELRGDIGDNVEGHYLSTRVLKAHTNKYFLPVYYN